MTTVFLTGASSLAAAAIALFFLRFWRQTADRFFLLFALAFAFFAVNRGLLAAVDPEHESRWWLYVLRLLAFGLILAAIVDKNWGDRRPRARARAG